jgi:NADH-quinone oxidoreductase subunit A
VLAIQSPDSEKTSAYECGFEPFEDARNRFDVRFYIVAILFLLFDIEVAFLFPWAATLGRTGGASFAIVALFLLLLTAGFIYEVVKGALNLHLFCCDHGLRAAKDKPTHTWRFLLLPLLPLCL